VSFNTVISAHLKKGNLEAAEKLIKEMKRRGVHPNEATFGSLIEFHVKRGDVERAESLVRELEQSEGVRPDAKVFTSLLGHHARLGDTRAARRLLERMLKDGVALDKWTCTLLVKCLGQKEDTENVKKVVEFMRKAKIGIDAAVLSAVLSLRAKKGDLEGAEAELEKWLREDGGRAQLKRDKRSALEIFNILLDGHAKKGDVWAAERSFRTRAKEFRATPNVSTFNTLIHYSLEAGLLKKAETVFEEMKKQNVGPNEATEGLRKRLEETLKAKK
jgi:pentatricopeptide repeat protein